MNTRAALAVIVYILAVAVPAFGLYIAFGLETAVDLSSVTQLAALVGAALFTFASATLGGVLLHSSEQAQWSELIEALSEKTDQA